MSRVFSNCYMSRICIDNLKFDGNIISSTDTDGNINLNPNGNGVVDCNAPVEIHSTTNGDASGGTALTSLEGTGLRIKRQIDGSNLGDFRLFIGGTLSDPNAGFGSSSKNALVIKDVDQTNYAYYHSQYTKNLSLFTGSHISKIDPTDSVLSTYSDDLIGRVVSSTGNYSTLDVNTNAVYSNKYDAVQINDSHPIVKLTDSINDTTVYGVVSSFEAKDASTRDISTGGIFVRAIPKDNLSDRRVIVNALGEGGIWILNTNGNITNGDFVSSYYDGYCQKQDSTVNNNYTVAKVTCSCNFDENSDWNDTNDTDSSKYKGKTVIIDGQSYRAAFLGCIYLCG